MVPSLQPLAIQSALPYHACGRRQDSWHKKAEQGENEFISSNDIITSYFLSSCKAPYGGMAVNFRGRLKNHNDDMAGNYLNMIFYKCPDDTSTPRHIRASFKQLKQTESADTIPSTWEFCKGSLGLVTNWATFAKPVAFAGRRELLHVPEMPELSISTLSVCVIFRAGPGKLGLFIAGTEQLMKLPIPFESNEVLNLFDSCVAKLSTRLARN